MAFPAFLSACHPHSIADSAARLARTLALPIGIFDLRKSLKSADALVERAGREARPVAAFVKTRPALMGYEAIGKPETAHGFSGLPVCLSSSFDR